MSFDYKVNLADARRILGGHIAFAGNMNPVVVMQKQTPEGVAASCAQCIEQASGKAGGYIVMPGCDIPPSVPLANVKAMVQAAHHYN
jgi:uroporphyrinogen decarboxylase